MAYRVKKRLTVAGEVYFRVSWEKYKANLKQHKHIPESDWIKYGFHPQMTLEEAKNHAKHLNAKDKIVQIEQKRQNIVQLLKDRDTIDDAFLPGDLIKEFENDIIKGDLGTGSDERLKYSSTPSHWRMAKRVIVQLKLEPSEWYDRRKALYNVFKQKSMSPSYVQKVLRLMNLWGYFYCKRMRLPWEKVPRPTGMELEAIRDEYLEAGGSETESDPMTLDHLDLAKKNLTKLCNYEWLYVCTWFGLRPIECDSLRTSKSDFSVIDRNKPGTWTTSNDGTVDILWIYQSKLTGIERRKRWKGIPIVESEQTIALSIIEAIQQKDGKDDYSWKRPVTKTIKAALRTDLINSYGPRKGFYALMKKRGYLTEDISRWLGHTNIRITLQSYDDRRIVHYRKSA